MILHRFRPIYESSLAEAQKRSATSTRKNMHMHMNMDEPNAQKNLVFAEFRTFIIFLCLHASMLDMLQVIQDSGPTRGTSCTTKTHADNDDQRSQQPKIHSTAFLQGYTSLKDFGFVSLQTLQSKEEAKRIFQCMDVTNRGFITFQDWSTYLKKEEMKRGTPIGKFLAASGSGRARSSGRGGSKPTTPKTLTTPVKPRTPGKGSRNNTKMTNVDRPSTRTMDTRRNPRSSNSTPSHSTASLSLTRSSPSQSRASTRQSSRHGSSRYSAVASSPTTSRPSSTLSRGGSVSRSGSRKTSTTSKSQGGENRTTLVTFPLQIGACHIQKNGSTPLRQFLSTFHLLASKSPKASKLRRKEFDGMNMGSKEVTRRTLEEIEAFILSKLVCAYGDVEGVKINDVFRPSYKYAFHMTQRITVSSDATSDAQLGVSFEQFRVMNVCLCIYAAMLDAFTTANGSKGITPIDESMWLAHFNELKSLGFAGVSTILNNSDARVVFRLMDTDANGLIDFDEFCAYLKKEEIDQSTELGKLFSGSLMKNSNVDRTSSPKSVVSEDANFFGEQGQAGTRTKSRNNQTTQNCKPNGVSVHWLEHGFMKEVLDYGLDRDSIIYQIDDLNQDKKNGVIRSKGANVEGNDGKLGAAYVDCLEGEDNVGPANIMMSYASGNAIGDIVDTLVEFCNTSQLDTKRTYVWISCLCINQHRFVEQTKSGDEMPFDEFRDVFYKRIEGIGHVVAMLSPWNEPLCLSRIWCIVAIYTANQSDNCKLSMVMPPKEREKMKQSLNDEDGLRKLYRTLSQSKVQYAKAAYDKERQSILKLVESDTPGFTTVNCDVNTMLLGWIESGVLEAIHMKEGESNEMVMFGEFCSQVASVLEENKEYDEAMKLYQKTLRIQESYFGFNHPTVALSHSNIAAVHHKKGSYEEALKEYKIALDFQNSYGVGAAQEAATTINNIAVVLEKQGDYEAALKEYRNSITLKEEVLEANDISFATTFENIGSVLKKKGLLDDAITEYRKALGIRQNKQGKHSDTAAVHNNLGGVLYMKGQYDEALVEFQTALAIRESVLGPYHQATAYAHNNLGMCHRKKRDFEKATIEFRKAIAIEEYGKGTLRPVSASHRQIIDTN